MECIICILNADITIKKNSPETIGFGENHIQILINRIKEYGDILVLVKFETNSQIE